MESAVLNNVSVRYFDKSAIYIIVLISAIIAAGQYSNAILSSFALRMMVSVAMIGLTLIIPSVSMALVSLGYFIPLVLGATFTLLPANYYYYFAIMVLSLLCTSIWNSSNTYDSKNSLQLKIIFPYVAFLLIVIVSELFVFSFSNESHMTVNYFLSFTLGLIGMLLIKRQKDQDIVLMTIVAVGVFLSGWALFGPVKLDATGSRYAIGFDQNYYSFFIGLSMVILTSFLFHRASLKMYFKVLFTSFLLLEWIAILRLGSRGVLVAIVAATLWIVLRNSRNLPQTLLNFAIVGLLVFVVLHLPGIHIMTDRFRDTDVSTFSRRLPLWMKSLDHIKNSSVWELFFGGGTDSGRYALGKGSFFHTPVSPHNQYLETAMDYGFLGLFTLLWLLFNGYRQSRRMRGYSGDVRIGIIVFMVVCFLTLTPLRYVLPWIAFGLILSKPVEREDNDISQVA